MRNVVCNEGILMLDAIYFNLIITKVVNHTTAVMWQLDDPGIGTLIQYVKELATRIKSQRKQYKKWLPQHISIVQTTHGVKTERQSFKSNLSIPAYSHCSGNITA